jgi:hypothetical protein
LGLDFVLALQLELVWLVGLLDLFVSFGVWCLVLFVACLAVLFGLFGCLFVCSFFARYSLVLELVSVLVLVSSSVPVFGLELLLELALGSV